LSGTLTSLYSFCSQANCADGDDPMPGLVLDTDGNFYGTTASGGSTDGGAISPRGTVFEIKPGGATTEIYSFPLSDGNLPMAGLVQASNGDLYGTTTSGGNPDESGTVFKVGRNGGEAPARASGGGRRVF
jgi:hypothetical protein